MMELSDFEVIEIKNTWKIPMADPSGSGQAILLKFFERYPHNKLKFQDFKDQSLDQLKTCPKFKAHASRIVRTFNEAINVLGTDYTDPALHEIFSKVAISHHKRGISKASYNELKEVILEIVVAVCEMNDCQKCAWEKLMETIYELISRPLIALKSEVGFLNILKFVCN
uniref:Globin domain-containing protein n=1 Tax=Megaselia scalaris TaxID=36166 RepID=T1GN60_MEGSC